MDHRLRIAVATCGPTFGNVEHVAARFAAVSEVVAIEAASDGSDADAVVPELKQAAPDAVVALPRVAARLLQAGLATPVIPMDTPAGVLLGRVTAALDEADSVALLPPADSVSLSTTRLVQRLGRAVHILPHENHRHLQDLITRCRRMGAGALIGGESLKSLALPEGLRAFSLVDAPDETGGMMGQAVVRAVAHAASGHADRADELTRLSLILEKIARGEIGPRDTALCVDRRDRVTAAFAPPATAGRELALAPPGELSIIDFLAPMASHAPADAGEAGSPVALDLYPLPGRAGGGYLAVLHASPRPAALLAGDGGEVLAGAGGDRFGRMVQRLDALVEQMETRTKTRRARHAPRRFLASPSRGTVLLDWRRVRYFELRSGLVYAALATGETYATDYTLADIAARVDRRDFFRIHRNVIVNLNYVVELERYAAGQFRVLVDGPDAPSFVVSRQAAAVLRTLRKLLKY